MKKYLFAAAIGALAISGIAYADDNNPTWYDYGTVTAVGPDSVTLSNGNSYHVMDVQDLRGLRVGEKADFWLENGNVTSISNITKG